MTLSRILVLLAVAAQWGVFAAEPPKQKDKLSPEGMRRAGERMHRWQVQKGYAEAHKNALKDSLLSLDKTVMWLAESQAKEDAKSVIKEIETVNPEYANLPALKKSADAITDGKYLDGAKQIEFAKRLKTARKNRADALLALARTCFEAKLLGNAYDLIFEILNAEPDNQAARNALAQGKIGDRWYSAFEASQLNAGKIYLPAKGWVFKQAADRVQKGEWFEQNKWMSLEDANKLHAKRATPWEIETASFILKSTDSLVETIKIAERLEGIRKFCFREYLQYFIRGSGAKGSQLLFNQAAPKKMLVFFFGTKDDFDAFIMKEVRGDTALLLNSAGFYKSSMHASFFYHGDTFGTFLYTLMQHEVTHQILGEYASGGSHPTWLAEGVADVLGHSKLVGTELQLPPGIDHPDVLSAATAFKRGKMTSVDMLLGLTHEMFHMEPGRHEHYSTSGAFCRFLLEFQDGIYAADFLDFLYDSYKLQRASDLTDYVGMDVSELDKQFKAYLEVEYAKIRR